MNICFEKDGGIICSYDRRAELDVRLAIPSAQSACGMEIFTKNGMAVSAMPFFYRIGNFVSIR